MISLHNSYEPERTLTYTYDRQGNITSRRFQAGVTGQSFFTWYDYDGFGRLSEIRTNTTNSYTDANIDAAYTYSATGNRQNLSLNQGSNGSWMEEVEYSYNMRGWLTSINDPNSLGDRQFGMSINYYNPYQGNYNGNISSVRWRTPELDSDLHGYDYYYDRANRLVKADYRFNNAPQSATLQYQVRGTGTSVNSTLNTSISNPIRYDSNGNFTTLIRNDDLASSTQYNYQYSENTNRLRNTIGNSADNYQYDAAGNVIANSERNINRMTYDHRNLAQHISTDGGLHQYTYNPEGLRIGKQYSPTSEYDWTVNKRYIYGAYGELIAQFDGATVDYWNISGPEGETIGRKGLVVPPVGIGDLISMEQGNYIGYSRFYYLKDHLGSVRVTLGQDGTVMGYDDYYPFGLQMPKRNNNRMNPHDDQKFTGHFFEQDGDLEIYHAQARMYDPAIGRFLGVDAMRGLYPSFNSYHYVLNNPIIFLDPTGEYVVSQDGTYVTRVTNGGANLISRLQYIPVVGTFATLTKLGVTSGDPSINMNAADYVNLATLGFSSTLNALTKGVTGMTRAEKLTIRTMNSSKQTGSTALGAAFTDTANLFIDEGVFAIAQNLGLGRINIANRGFFEVNKEAMGQDANSNISLHDFITNEFQNIANTLINLANDRGFDLNTAAGRSQLARDINELQKEDMKSIFNSEQ